MNAQTPKSTDPQEARLDSLFGTDKRVVIELVSPSVDSGRYPVKSVVGAQMTIQADIFADGHEKLRAAIILKAPDGRILSRTDMTPLGNDRWTGDIALTQGGYVEYQIEAWLDVYGGFTRDTEKKRDAGLSLAVEAEEGRLLVAAAAARGAGKALNAVLSALNTLAVDEKIALLLAEETRTAMGSADPQAFLAKSVSQIIDVERREAGFASWYELFPRSQANGRHGTFRDVIAQLPRIHAMGFDVLYMPPIHPIGNTNRKGRNNALTAAADDPGSPYAIGGAAGGHEAVHPQLGTLADFRALVDAARDLEIEIALDFAVQMSPDHPWIAQHPDWFQRRPDGSMKYAENPPKKYQDIVNPDFYKDKFLWRALRDIILHWIDNGVRIFRVDNPHTKPLPFWEWIIGDIRNIHPDVIFLAEAFTRPKPMYQLAKLGFSQSYSYFTWRDTKAELTAYLTELGAAPVRDYFRPNFFVNTPDINPPFLQTGGRPAFLIRAALAATLSGLWGVYSGFEICEAAALPGREEYQDSEKYELRQRDFAAAGNIIAEITQLNNVRRRQPALQTHLGVTFYNAFNDNILYYGKRVAGREEIILVAVNLDPFNDQSCNFEIPLWEWGLADHEALAVEDLLHGHQFTWAGKIQHMHLETTAPYAIWRVQPGRELA